MDLARAPKGDRAHARAARGVFGQKRRRRVGFVQVFDDCKRLRQHATIVQLERDDETGTFCHGESPTLADICLVPQLANARRFKVDVTPYPTLTRIEAACNALPAFAQAAPSQQPDAE